MNTPVVAELPDGDPEIDLPGANAADRGGRPVDSLNRGIDFGLPIDHLAVADAKQVKDAPDTRCANAYGFLRDR